MKILIAEDECVFHALYKKLMKSWHFDFDLVSNGREAVNKVVDIKNEYDICVMDIDMPVMNGCEATKLIRLEKKNLPIIAVTGHLDFQYKYSEFGMDACILKPFKYDQLFEKIIELTAIPEK